MATAKTTTKKAAKVSKRKSTSAKKTKTTKTKISKTQKKAVKTTVEVKPEIKREKVVTSRTRRMAEKAKIRASIPAVDAPEMGKVRITDVSGVVYEAAEFERMAQMYDATIKDIREGEIVNGIILGVTRDDVIVDVGFKSEGIISVHEFVGETDIKVGDPIDVYLEQIEDSNGQLILSKQKADFMRVWDEIREIHDSGDTIEGRIVRRIKGGLVVDVKGVDAFLPGSQVALRQVPDSDALLNQMM